MKRSFVPAALALALVASSAAAQLPGLRRYPAAPTAPQGTAGLRADLIAHAGTDTVYFAGDSAILSVPAKTALQAEALWLRQHPEVSVRIEGHAEPSDTRDYAIAIGAKRAEEVRDFLILMGVPAAQVSAMSWGKERPGAPRVISVLMPGSGGVPLVPAGG